METPDQNADGGTAANLFEFLAGTDPLDPGDDALPTSEVVGAGELGLAGGDRYLTLTARLRTDRAGVSVFAEAAATVEGLSSPAAAGNAIQITPTVPDGDFEWATWYYATPVASGETGFMRLKAVAE